MHFMNLSDEDLEKYFIGLLDFSQSADDNIESLESNLQYFSSEDWTVDRNAFHTNPLSETDNLWKISQPLFLPGKIICTEFQTEMTMSFVVNGYLYLSNGQYAYSLELMHERHKRVIGKLVSHIEEYGMKTVVENMNNQIETRVETNNRELL